MFRVNVFDQENPMDAVLEVTKCDCRCSDRIEEAHIRLEIWKMMSSGLVKIEARTAMLKECADFVFGHGPATADSSTTDTTSDIGQANTV